MPRRMAYIPPAETDVPLSSCYLVWLPDDRSYRAAFWGAYSDLAQYWLWDEEDATRREEITQSWLAAIAQTLECADMTCLEDILTELAAIKAAIYATACCGDTIIISDSYNTNIVYNQGTAPATWGDGETVADWADWYELVCAQAHEFVDKLIAVAVAARETLLAGTLAISTVTGWLRHITFLSLLLDIANTLAQTVWGEMLETGADSWDNVATNLESAREDIVCAILYAGDFPSLIQTAVGTVAWAAFYSHIDYDTALAIMYEGGAGGEYLAATRRDDCACTEPGYVELFYGTDQGGGVYASELAGGCHYVQLQVWNDSMMTERWSTDWTGSQTSTSGSCGGAAIHRVTDESLQLVYSGDNVNFPVDELGHRYTVTHGSSFTVSISRSSLRHEGT